MGRVVGKERCGGGVGRGDVFLFRAVEMWGRGMGMGMEMDGCCGW